MNAAKFTASDAQAVLRAGVPHPNEYTNERFPAAVKLATASDPKWEQQKARAREQGREDYVKGYTRDPDGLLCAAQIDQLRQGVEDVRIGRSIHGWYVRTDWADGVVLFRHTSAAECIAFAMNWHVECSDRRGVWIGGTDHRDVLAELSAAA